MMTDNHNDRSWGFSGQPKYNVSRRAKDAEADSTMEPATGEKSKTEDPLYDGLATRKALTNAEYLKKKTEARKKEKAERQAQVSAAPVADRYS